MKKTLIALALAANAVCAQAQALVPGELVIYEYLGTGIFGPLRPYYIVANGTDRDISAFGVTNNYMGDNRNADQAGWEGAAFDISAWNNSRAFYHEYYGLPLGVVNAGSFSDNFGDTNWMVNFYWNRSGEAIKAGATSDKFYFGGPRLSEFKAWDTMGNAIYEEHRSAVHAVPEPESYALMLSGLAVLAVASRRRKSGALAAFR